MTKLSHTHTTIGKIVTNQYLGAFLLGCGLGGIGSDNLAQNVIWGVVAALGLEIRYGRKDKV